jgi:hypothetical protein
MISGTKKGRLFLLVVFLWVFWLTGGAYQASGQAQAYVTVSDTSLSSGDTYQRITVLLQNDVPIKGIEFFFTLGSPSITDFTTDYIEIRIDTISLDPLDIDTTEIRNCKIGTARGLLQDFEWVEAHGEVSDTAFLDCDWVKVAGMAKEGSPIPPGAGVLLELYVDVLCIPDTVQERIVTIFANGNLSDPDGNRVEVEFANSIIYLNQTFCGNLSDCICGDVNADGGISIVDVVYMINWLFNEGPDLCPEIMGDVNLYRGVGIADIVALINYLFNDGPEPVCVRKY